MSTREEEDAQAIRMFVLRFGVNVEALNGLLSVAQESTQGSSRAEREHVAREVLFHFGDAVNGYQAGGFVSGLLVLFGKADMGNRGRLASVFPLYATALQLYNTFGKDALLEWGTRP